jgi:hypothetical protein
MIDASSARFCGVFPESLEACVACELRASSFESPASDEGKEAGDGVLANGL